MKIISNQRIIISFLFLLLAINTQSTAQQSLNMSLLGSWDENTIEVSGLFYNDIWGYVDDQGNEYAILGSPAKVHFIDVTTPASPSQIYEHTGGSTSLWRDFKTYKKFAYAVADQGNEGMLIFDLSGLPASPPVLINTITQFTQAHNIFIDVPNGMLYVAGSNFSGNGVMVYDLKSDPANPTLVFANSLSGGYVHDIYVRDNIAYTSHGFNGFYMYDFTTPSAPQFIDSRFTGGYNHSSWLTDDGQYGIYAEEVPSGRPLGIINLSDVPNNGIGLVRTFKFPLLAPQETNATPHNPFIAGDYCIVSYYEDGVQIFDISDKSNPVTAAYYDTNPNNTTYNGTTNNWGVYPYFPSGTIIACDTKFGMSVLSTTLPIPTTCADGIKNGSELGVDCGGFCKPCPDPPVSSFSASQTVSCVGTISFTDLSSGSASSWLWDFGDGTTSTLRFPSHTYTNPGTYTVSLTVTNSSGADTNTKANYITINLPTALGADFCPPGTATLTATFPPGQLNWYDNTGNYLTTATSYTTPILNNTTTYYAEGVQIDTQYVGPPNSNFSGGEFHNTSAKYLIFRVFEDLTLVSAWVNSNQAGTRTIELRDGNGALINSFPVNIPDGISRIALNLDLTPGDYQIGGDNMNLFRNNANVNYPYALSNLVEITASTNGPNHYYYFYDWELHQTSCISTQIPVTANALPTPVSTFSATTLGNTATFSSTSQNATAWLWDFGDGNTSILENPVHTYANIGSYTVSLQASNACGMQSSNQTIVLTTIPQLTVNLTAVLEGTYDQGTSLMTTQLWQLELFPSTGQPYGIAPWNYLGTEGVGWQSTDYPADAVDWVLVSLRSAEDAQTTVGRAAGLLLSDGTVSVDIQLLSGNVLGAYYVVLEHRNHLPVMSPTLLPVSNNEITYDFTVANSYSSSTSFGQKNNGFLWMLYGGNADQLNTLGHEITGSDIIPWQQDNGNFNIYSESDFNLDGDINANDKILWSYNNGIFSILPR